MKQLLNENKIKMMTKMAIYEKNEGKSEVYGIAYPKEDIGLFEKEIVTE